METKSSNTTLGISKDSTQLSWWFSFASQLSTLIATASEMDLKFADWEQSLFYTQYEIE